MVSWPSEIMPLTGTFHGSSTCLTSVSKAVKFTMGQRPTPFFFGTLAFVIVGTIRLDTLVDHRGQVPLARQCGHVAMAVVGHPQRLTTCFTQLPEWSQGRFVRRHGARSSSSHLLSPVGVSLLFLGLSACFSFQLTPPFKPSLPFSIFCAVQSPNCLRTSAAMSSP